MKAYHRLTPAQKEAIRELYQSGLTRTQLSLRYGVSPKTIQVLVRAERPKAGGDVNQQ
jgi:DNA-binding CsgD family transcriptional regulator